jgi:uncharacterized lipoprotein YbaY/heat shock protein HslJ
MSMLEGVTWQLTEYLDQAGVATTPATPATLTFAEGRIGGNAGCNSFSGDYTVDGQQLTVGQVASTMMACAEPAMDQEQALFANLGQVVAYEVVEGQLRLLNEDGAPLLSFAGSQPDGVLTGTVTYQERVALPPGSIIEVQLQDVSRADAPATVIASQTITTTGENVPIPFTLTYDPAEIDPRFTYALSVRITVEGQLRWINTEHDGVLTRGAPLTGVEVVVQPAQ